VESHGVESSIGPRILITGASGFIGGQLFERVRADGWRATGIGRRALPIDGYIQHDLTEPLPELAEPFDVVVHAAARSSPWGSRREFERQNVEATQHVIDYCRAHGRPRLIFISSSSVYYRPGHQLGITEETPMPERAVNHYAATKQVAEERVKRYEGNWVILRPRAVFGPNDTVLLPRILEAARAGRLPRLVSPDGPATGDVIYIDNLVDCIVHAAAAPAIGGSFNLTNAEPVVIETFLFDLFHRLGIPLPRRRVSVRTAMLAAGALELVHAVFLPQREPSITRFGIHVFAYSKTFDVSKMLTTMGTPRVPLAEGVERTVAWLRKSVP
jgi:nucleoside-diphosphate-sugar epimerase